MALLTACGGSGSSGTTPTTTAAGGDGSSAGASCAPVAGDALVVLKDDKNLQTVDNIIPAVSAAASTPELLDVLNAVSAKLDTDSLVQLNADVDQQRMSPEDAAKAFLDSSGVTEGLSGGSGTIIVGGGNFTESQVLASVYSQALTAAGYDSSVQSVGNREIYLPALQAGTEIQVFPEYVGTLATFLNGQANGTDEVASSDLDMTVANLTTLGEAAGLTFGEPAEAADQNAFAVTKALADQLGVTTLSELAAACGGGDLILGGPAECPERPFCQAGLESTYDLTFASFTSLDAGGPLTKAGLTQGDISIGLVFSSDAVFAQG